MLTAIFIALFVAGVFWVVMRYAWDRQIIQKRMEEPAGAQIFSGAPEGSLLRAGDEVTLENVGRDPISKDLFLAGIRLRRQATVIKFLLKVSIFAPFVILFVYSLDGLTYGDAFRAILLGGGLHFYIRLFVKTAKQKRQKRILRALPQFLDLLVVCVEAGLSFTSAVERLLKDSDPRGELTRELQLMHYEFLGGLSLQQSADRLAARCETPDLTLLMHSIINSDTMGSSLAGTLRTQSVELRDKYRQRLRARAHQIPVKILFPTMLIFVTLFVMALGPTFYQLDKSMSKQTRGKTYRR